MYHYNFKSTLFVALIALSACSSDPKLTEIKSDADPQVELDRVDEKFKVAYQNQVNVLSPKNFEATIDAKDKAIAGRSKNKDQKYVLHNISLAEAYLDKATGITQISNQILKGPVEARQFAMNANAPKYYPKELSEIDKDLMKLTKKFEDNDTAISEKRYQELEAAYKELELKSIRTEKLGVAKNNIEEAVKEGAKKLTPKTLIWANDHMANDEAKINANPRSQAQVDEAAADALMVSNRLLKMVRTAKGSDAKNPEELALQAESNEMAASRIKKDLNQTNAALENTKETLDKVAEQNAQLQAQATLDAEYEKARAQFSTDEAEVYRQGNQLVIRLKGLAFANNKSELRSENFPLLAKVQKIIGEVGYNHVAIEGHTDSVGGKKLNSELSKKRAAAVQSYLVSNNNISPEKVSSAGLGDEKPIATNKTPEGRAQNRRVDIIISGSSTQ